jgi:hypothetical protein
MVLDIRAALGCIEASAHISALPEESTPEVEEVSMKMDRAQATPASVDPDSQRQHARTSRGDPVEKRHRAWDSEAGGALPDRSETCPTRAMSHDLIAHRGRKDTHPEDWLVGGGEMGKLIRSMDWSATPLGLIAAWPEPALHRQPLPSLQLPHLAGVGTPARADLQRRLLADLRGRHPHSMGQDFSKC